MARDLELRRSSAKSPANQDRAGSRAARRTDRNVRRPWTRLARVRRAHGETTSNSTGFVPWPLAVPTAEVSKATRGTDR